LLLVAFLLRLRLLLLALVLLLKLGELFQFRNLRLSLVVRLMVMLWALVVVESIPAMDQYALLPFLVEYSLILFLQFLDRGLSFLLSTTLPFSSK
jgi:hypothetical protein